ncbi:MAG: DUF72 domain-containing protein [bacterium]|nr:DUF72 domain-containing protein [bacterium]
MIRVGPAGWSYPDWEGRVYPRSKPRGFHPLAYLAQFVQCIEINSTFYAQPHARNAERWAGLVRPHQDFRFVCKLLSVFTHAPEPDDPAAWRDAAATWRAGIEPLRASGKLAAVLVQFPITYLHGPGEVRRLGRIRSLFDGLPLVLEVRHESWFAPPALDVASGLGYTVAHIDLPAAWNHPPAWHPAGGSIGYLRLHGRNAAQWFRASAGRDDRYDYLYPQPEVGELARKARRIAEATDETYVVTNNHFEGKAVANALELMYLFANRAPQPAPPQLVDSFPHLAPVVRIEGQQGLF